MNYEGIFIRMFCICLGKILKCKFIIIWLFIVHSTCVCVFGCGILSYPYLCSSNRKLCTIVPAKKKTGAQVATTALKTHRFFCTSAGHTKYWMISDRVSDNGCLSCFSGRSRPAIKQNQTNKWTIIGIGRRHSSKESVKTSPTQLQCARVCVRCVCCVLWESKNLNAFWHVMWVHQFIIFTLLMCHCTQRKWIRITHSTHMDIGHNKWKHSLTQCKILIQIIRNNVIGHLPCESHARANIMQQRNARFQAWILMQCGQNLSNRWK